MKTQGKAPPRASTKVERKQLLIYLRPDTILSLKSEALHANVHAYEIVQQLLDEHFARQPEKEPPQET